MHDRSVRCPVPVAGTLARIDESYEPRRVFILAAVVIPTAAEDDTRTLLRTLVRPTRDRTHFSKEDHGDRLRLMAAIEKMNLQAIVALHSGERNPERARGLCWAALLWELHGMADGLVIESRTPKENKRDARTIVGQRPRCCGPVSYQFTPALDDELLWVSDAVAGATFQARVRNRPEYLAALGQVPPRIVDV